MRRSHILQAAHRPAGRVRCLNKWQHSMALSHRGDKDVQRKTSILPTSPSGELAGGWEGAGTPAALFICSLLSTFCTPDRVPASWGFQSRERHKGICLLVDILWWIFWMAKCRVQRENRTEALPGLKGRGRFLGEMAPLNWGLSGGRRQSGKEKSVEKEYSRWGQYFWVPRGKRAP